MLRKNDFEKGQMLMIVANNHFDYHHYENGDKVKVIEGFKHTIFSAEKDRIKVKRLSDGHRQWVTFSDVVFINNSIKKIG